VLNPKRLAVIGQPIAHSRSPAIHNAALTALGLSGEWAYEAIEVAAAQFPDLVHALPERGFVGANVTVPHKRRALEVADRASARATEIGAANTLSFERGAVGADNTDAPGFLAALPASPRGRRALVLGAGGAARAVVWALVGGGATVGIWNRTRGRAAELAAELGATTVEVEDRGPGAVDPGRLRTEDYDLIVNATAVGMDAISPPNGVGTAGLKALHIAADGLRDRHVVVDLAYGAAETELIRAARERGATVVDGLEVLVRQGAESLRIWTGLDPPLDAMRRAASP
jgi:shikimate dehydrogenase